MATNYIVLCKPDSDARGWLEYASGVLASSADAAVRNAIAEGATSGSYVAVPLRSWQPLSITISSKPTAVIGKPE